MEIQRKKTNGGIDNMKTKHKMAGLSPHLLIITLDISGLSPLIKRHTVLGELKDKT